MGKHTELANELATRCTLHPAVLEHWLELTNGNQEVVRAAMDVYTATGGWHGGDVIDLWRAEQDRRASLKRFKP